MLILENVFLVIQRETLTRNGNLETELPDFPQTAKYGKDLGDSLRTIYLPEERIEVSENHLEFWPML